MLGNFVNGWGSDSYEFGKDSKFSDDAFSTMLFNDALTKYIDNGMPDEFQTKGIYGFMNQVNGIIKDKSVLTLENYLGSADVFFKKINATDVQIQIINVTSLTSGDLLKHLPLHGEWPKSTVG